MQENENPYNLPAPTYESWYRPNDQLHRCLNCGAAVLDTDRHTSFHTALGTFMLGANQSFSMLGKATGLED